MPIAQEVHRHHYGPCRRVDHGEQGAVRFPVMVFLPRDFRAVLADIVIADVVVLPEFGPAEAAEVFFSLGGSGVTSAVSL